MRITGIIHTRNSAGTVDRALRSLAWVSELIVVDMGSTDGTREIALRHEAKILDAPVVSRVDGIRNQYLQEASSDWIFVLDSDEYLAEDAAQSVAELIAERGATFDAFAIPRFNRIGDHTLRGSGWYPDHQTRLFRRGSVQWIDAVHEPPRVISGLHRLYYLEPPNCLHIHHQNYRDLHDFINRQVHYALSDTYSSDPEQFNFDEVMARAYRRLAARRDLASDGELSHALALIMAWDEIIRGLVHWEHLKRQPPLGDAVALPIAAATLDPGRAWRKSWRVRSVARLRTLLNRYPRLSAVLREARRRLQGPQERR